jgi:hypothetical protein
MNPLVQRLIRGLDWEANAPLSVRLTAEDPGSWARAAGDRKVTPEREMKMFR